MATWTAPRTWVVGEILTASDMNTFVSENTEFLFDQMPVPRYAFVNDEITTTSDAYTTLSDAGPALNVFVPANGRLQITVSAEPGEAGSSFSAMSFILQGANELSASDIRGVIGRTNYWTCSRTVGLSGLNAGATVVKAVYRVGSGGNTAHIRRRGLTVVTLAQVPA